MSCGPDGRAGGEDLELLVVKSGDELRTESKSDISFDVPEGWLRETSKDLSGWMVF